ncbi:hypothetical protein [Bordetella sp. BOR01]|uniref:hypothetical protein n=1 Tax=Bordetella sp. BOR01 TaxID=2854779 RepID=UPI001C492B86|nr:hypothetical protein [Bordetella sp. BOR01]MBV7486774.1 hypothetical protein [Bordetella sp. BOR01]
MTAHPRPPHDEDDDLDLRALYRTLPRTEPSPSLDAAVHEAAARAVAADRRVQRQRRLWHPGWGVAASIVLTACLFLLTDFQDPDMAGLADAPPVDAELASPPQAMPPPAAAPERPEAPAALRRYSPAPAATPAPARQARPAAPAESESAESATAQPPRAQQYSGQPDSAGGKTSAGQPAVEPNEPDARIVHIRELLQDGRRDAALQALHDLRRDAPDLALPPDLQALLPVAR